MTEQEKMEEILGHARLTTTTELDKQIRADVATALQEHLSVSTLRSKERILTMKRIKKIAVAAVLVLGVSALIGLLTRGNGTASLAFAEVVDQMQNVQSLSLDAILTVPNKPQRRYHSDISGARYRKTSSNGTFSIADGDLGKVMDVNPTNKSVYIRAYKSEGKHPIEFVLGFIDKLREAKTKDLGRRVLEGREVAGFRVQSMDAIQREQEIDIWVDLETHYPMRIEMLYKKQGASLVMHNFTWNPQLDVSLFDLKPPPGYAITDDSK